MWIASSIDKILKPTRLALGNFDGIHRGHQRVLQPIAKSETNQQLDREAPRQCRDRTYATVVSFTPHPREFFSGQKIQLLTPLEEKVKQLELLGIEQLVLLPFNRELATLNPQQFVAEILVKRLQASQISIGEDFHFGYQRQGNAIDLQSIASQFGIEVHIVSKLKCQHDDREENVRISSSLIRQALEEGNIEQANQMLGRPYTLRGTVVIGQQLGRTIGFPTANLKLPESKFLPRYGVYSVSVKIEDYPEAENLDDRSILRGVMNLGCRPTVNGQAPTTEVHLLDWSGNLYDRTLNVNLEQFLRSEQKFASLEDLQAQITRDCEAARLIEA